MKCQVEGPYTNCKGFLGRYITGYGMGRTVADCKRSAERDAESQLSKMLGTQGESLGCYLRHCRLIM